MINFRFSGLILGVLAFYSCKQNMQKEQPAAAETSEQFIQRTKTTFKTVTGIRYTEVYRRFAGGVSFNAQGYQLKPSWKIIFVSDTAVSVFSPVKLRYYDLPLILDHDSIFSMAGAWFKAKKISKDSLRFQVLSVKNKQISWNNSNVYVTFYAEDFLKQQHLSTEKLRLTTRQDTDYIHKLADASARDSSKIFAAQQPVSLKSNSASVRITSAKTKAKDLNSYYIPETLFYPEYQVTINKAYADFHHSFAIRVDANGKLHFVEPMEMMSPGQEENAIKVMKGIMDGYLAHYLQITPGNTLGIPHDTLILVDVRGSKS